MVTEKANRSQSLYQYEGKANPDPLLELPDVIQMNNYVAVVSFICKSDWYIFFTLAIPICIWLTGLCNKWDHCKITFLNAFKVKCRLNNEDLIFIGTLVICFCSQKETWNRRVCFSFSEKKTCYTYSDSVCITILASLEISYWFIPVNHLLNVAKCPQLTVFLD